MAARETRDGGIACHAERWSAMEQERVVETKEVNI